MIQSTTHRSYLKVQAILFDLIIVLVEWIFKNYDGVCFTYQSCRNEIFTWTS